MKTKNSMKILALSVVTSALFVGCGSNDSNNTPQTPPPALTGTFVDAPVAGLAYKTATQSGFTDANGKFKYKAGEDVEFKLGNLFLGKGKAGALLTPYTVSENNTTATNIALVLQNFDTSRNNAGVLDLSSLKDANLSDVNLSVSVAQMETKINNLFSDPRFATKYSGVVVLDATHVKSAMDTSIKDNSTKHDKKFTQAYLDKTVFYKSSGEYPEYKNQYKDGKIYFAGDESNGSWDDSFTNASSTYTIVNGNINAVFSDGVKVTIKIIDITDSSITVEETDATMATRTSIWYTSKEAAAEAFSPKISLDNKKFTEDYLKNTPFYEVHTDNSDPDNSQEVGYTWILVNHFAGGQWYQNESGLNTSDHLPTGGDGDVEGTGYTVTPEGYLSVTGTDGNWAVKIIEVTKNYIKIVDVANPQHTGIWYTNLEAVKSILLQDNN